MWLAVVIICLFVGFRVWGSKDRESSLLDSLWREFVQRYSIGTELANPWLQRIKQRYGEPHRAYHTLTHIEEMLSLFIRFRDEITNPDAVFLAIIFHDVIYNPRANDNEELSALEFESFYKEVTNNNDSTLKIAVNSTLISEHILETKTHVVSPGLATDNDLLLFLDFDMAILGSERSEYLKYSEQIRTEYQHIPMETYAIKRCDVLKGFLDYISIYNTEIFKLTHEQTARDNLAREISHLTEVYESLKQEENRVEL